MPAVTVIRRWTIATWLVAGTGDRLDAVVNALRSVGADAVALQSIRRDDAERVATALDHRVAWEVSHYPSTPLLRSSGVGLCVLSPHAVVHSESGPIGDARSVWSRKRRIVQSALVRRADHSDYRIIHQVGAPLVSAADIDGGNTIVITPEQVEADASRAIELPPAATLVHAQTERPIATVAPLQTTTFEMAWVQGDFPVG